MLPPLLVLFALSAEAGCESAADKCARLQREAASAWGAYAAVLERGAAQARSARDAAQTKIGALDQQLTDEARAQADRLHEPKSSAWWRAVDAAQQSLCTKHPECMDLKAEIARAKQQLAELQTRLTAVHAAQSAATAAAAEAKRAAAAVDDDFEHAELKPARAAAAAADEACADIAR